MATGPHALTTLQDAKDYLRLPDSTDDNLIERMIDAATDKIENYCGRNFHTRTYTKELHNGDGTTELFVDNPPVTAVGYVSASIEDAMLITNTLTDATRATISVTATGVTGLVEGGAGAGTDTTTFVAAATFDLLATAINAWGDGWSATVLEGLGDILSAELIPMGGRNALNVTTSLIFPSTDTYSDYTTVWGEGVLLAWNGWPSGQQNIAVTYTGGYTTTPEDIVQACLMIVASMFNTTKRDIEMKSETLGDYSYTAFDSTAWQTFPPTVSAILDRYKLHGGWV